MWFSSRKNDLMDSEVLKFLYLNGIVVVVLVIYMLLRRPKNSPSRLKLRETLFSDKLDIHDSSKNSKNKEWRPWGTKVKKKKSAWGKKNHDTADDDSSQQIVQERQLTCVFQFNGHDFEAYEVFGLPAGTSLDTVDETYQEVIKSQPSDTHPFYQKAYEALVRKK